MVVAHLVEQLLPTPEFCGSNPVIGKNLYWTFVYCQLFIEKTKIKKKMPGMAHFLKRVIPQRVDIHILSRAIMLYLCPTTNPIEQLTSLEGLLCLSQCINTRCLISHSCVQSVHCKASFGWLVRRQISICNNIWRCCQCDQIGRFIGLWATFQNLWQQLVYPNLPHT